MPSFIDNIVDRDQHRSLIKGSIRYYGWTPSRPDIRDRLFTVNRALLTAMPVAFDLTQTTDLSEEPFTKPWNQGSQGSCGPHTGSGDLVFAQCKQDNVEMPREPSRHFIYYVTRTVMGTVNQDSGIDNRSMGKALLKYGWCDEELDPYSDTKQAMVRPPSQAAYDQAATRKITEYLNVQQDLTTMQGCLAGGDTFIFGFSVYQSMESQAVAQTGIIPMPRTNERQVGGHDVLIVGYNAGSSTFNGIPPNHFKLLNSWGMWGNRGYGYIPFAYATNQRLSGDFWTWKKSGITPVNPPDPPIDPPDPPVPGKYRLIVECDAPIVNPKIVSMPPKRLLVA